MQLTQGNLANVEFTLTLMWGRTAGRNANTVSFEDVSLSTGQHLPFLHIVITAHVIQVTLFNHIIASLNVMLYINVKWNQR